MDRETDRQTHIHNWLKKSLKNNTSKFTAYNRPVIVIQLIITTNTINANTNNMRQTHAI